MLLQLHSYNYVLVQLRDRIGKMNQWDRETLKSRVVQIRRHGEELLG